MPVKAPPAGRLDTGTVEIIEDRVYYPTGAYPQMGGYGAQSIISFSAVTGATGTDGQEEPGCFDVEVWHNGEWPFGAEKMGRVTGKCEVCAHPYGYAASPSSLHHCAAEQFVELGLLVLELQRKYQKRSDGTPVSVNPTWGKTILLRLAALLAEPEPS